MSEHEAVKVYELAKELGIDSISLLDKLRDLNIKVKNHMSELSDEESRVARSALMKKVAGTSAPKKTVAKTRKKVEAPAAASTSPAAAAPATVESSSGEKKSAPVLRRRTKSDGATETVASAASARTSLSEGPTGATAYSQGSAAHSTSSENTQSLHPTGAEAYSTELAPEEAAGPASEEEQTETLRTASDSSETIESVSTPGMAANMVPPAETESPALSAEGGMSAGGGAGLSASAGGALGTTTPSRTLRPPVVLPPRPVAPRRSILKIVEPVAPPPRPMQRPTPSAPGTTTSTGPKPNVRGVATQDKDGFRIIKMTKENLDQMVEEEAAKKRGGGRENDIRPEDVRFADYRKKEMVFLPKKKKLPVGKEIRKTQLTETKAQKRIVQMQETISVQDLASQLSVKAVDVIRKLMGMGQMATINQALDFDTATLVANEYKHEVRNVAFNENTIIDSTEDNAENMKPRPPIVTIMGHVDHGKTTLLDAIREANVAGGEAGGITQHIGAYTVEKNGKLITFIDTPGHEAFSVMRARGANVTDIVILVVSADDGVMPQTREALSHAQAAKVPIIVAVNKIDKPGANPEKIKQGLAELNLLAEDWGGETMFVPVSALKKTNLDKLLDSILLQAEVLDLKGNPEALASGTVLEARLEKGRGPMISLLVKRGTLKVGDSVVAGSFSGKVKALTDDKGRAVKSAGPGFAAEVLGFEGVPAAGERFDATPTDSDAKEIVSNRIDKARNKAMAGQGKISLEDLFSKIQMGDVKELNVILKGDVFGSVEAIKESLIKSSTEKVKVKVIHAAPGGITESDVLLATASGAIIIGFNVRPETKARQVAESEHVEIKCYSIIYELLDDIKKAMAGLLDKKKVERFLGRAEVRQIFSVPKVGVVAGSSVVDGKILRGANVRLLRESRIIYEGKMSSLRRFKDDVKEVATGFECGIGIENYNDLKPGDLIEAYQIDLVSPTLDS